MPVTLADFGGGLPEPEIPTSADLSKLDDRMRNEIALLYAKQPELFN